jgi:hypothetical protein
MVKDVEAEVAQPSKPRRLVLRPHAGSWAAANVEGGERRRMQDGGAGGWAALEAGGRRLGRDRRRDPDEEREGAAAGWTREGDQKRGAAAGGIWERKIRVLMVFI